MTSISTRWLGAAAVVASIACAGSTPTRVTREWKDPSAVASPSMTKVVVMGALVKAEQRRTLEDRFVSGLASEGIHAAPSYRVLGDPLPDLATSRAMLQRAGYHGAVAVRLGEVSERRRHVEGSTPGPYAFAPQAYGTVGSVRDPGFWVTDTVLTFETSLWDLRDDRRVWVVISKTENPSSSSDYANSLTKEVVPRLADSGLIGKGSGG